MLFWYSNLSYSVALLGVSFYDMVQTEPNLTLTLESLGSSGAILSTEIKEAPAMLETFYRNARSVPVKKDKPDNACPYTTILFFLNNYVYYLV